MNLILAIDLRSGQVVHGSRGNRESYRPLDWGLVKSADPLAHLTALQPKYIYIADLDRIMGVGSNEKVVMEMLPLVTCCYLDCGCQGPGDLLEAEGVVNVIGTETVRSSLESFSKGFLSIDIKDFSVIPTGEDPIDLLSQAGSLAFDGVIILNVGGVGTSQGIIGLNLTALRACYKGKLLYGGGICGPEDLFHLRSIGFDGGIVATGVHTRAIPLSWVRQGLVC
ncbi:MAG: HisA/HisF-related TIM barrel protein [Methanomicrobiales archaeon]|nr:HisA/HisF-related TIM barrel protein [Methanomicrobiales archaeon]